MRHDTLLYAKQSYSSAFLCEFPDARVEPYPEFFGRLRGFAERGLQLADLAAPSAGGDSNNALAGDIRDYFQTLAGVATMLGEMAVQQQTGTPFTEDQLAFVNRAVSVGSAGCDTPDVVTDGRYRDLFYNTDSSAEFDPTIADVHTAPTDELGAPTGRVLHVGTGYTRAMVVTAETCDGPRAYAGLASSFHQLVTEDYRRLDDYAWLDRVQTGDTQEASWLQPVVTDNQDI